MEDKNFLENRIRDIWGPRLTKEKLSRIISALYIDNKELKNEENMEEIKKIKVF